MCALSAYVFMYIIYMYLQTKYILACTYILRDIHQNIMTFHTANQAHNVKINGGNSYKVKQIFVRTPTYMLKEIDRWILRKGQANSVKEIDV